jgi:ubiquinol-cytochrome c reductase iron-sulfur subunit
MPPNDETPTGAARTHDAASEDARIAEARRRGRRAERAPALAFSLAIVASIGLAVVYWRGGQPQAEGVLLAVVLGGIGTGLALFARRFLPHGPYEEERGQIGSTDEEVAAFLADFEAGNEQIARRGFLAALAAGSLGALGLAALFPIRSLGPRPGAGLKETGFAGGGKRLVTQDGQPVQASELAVDGVLTVFPEGHTQDADSPALLIHLRPGQNKPRPGRETWAPDDLVAYSKLCSHMGCPIGLYQAQAGLLLCPCHQSTFDVGDGCRPIFGPAATSLPQLPIVINADGTITATSDFSGPVGPGFWDMNR